MPCTRSAGVAMLLALLAAAPAAVGQEAGTGVDEQLKRMQEELERLRDDNEALRGEVDELRAQSDENWLTDRRAEEIKALVQDVLADADTRASLQSSGLTAGYDKRFFISSADGRFRLELDGQLQVRYAYNYIEENTGIDRHRSGFDIPRAKLTFRGHVFSPDIQYLVRLNAMREQLGAGSANGIEQLQDAWIRFVLNDAWSLRLGQFKLPFMREKLVYSSYQLAVERSVVEDKMNIGRSQGLELAFNGDASRLSLVFSDAPEERVGQFTPSSGNLTAWSPIVGGPTPATGPSPLVKDVDFTVSGRWELKLAGTWQQFEDFTGRPGDEFGLLFGVAGFWAGGEWGETGTINGIPTPSQNDESIFTGATVDISAEWGGANAFAAFTWEYLDTGEAGPRGPNGETNSNIFGLVVQGGVYVAPKWEVFGRYEWSTWDPDRPFDEVPGLSVGNLSLITFGVNNYIEGHDVKWTTDFGFNFQPVSIFYNAPLTDWRAQAGTGLQFVFRTQVQLLF